MLKIQEFIKSHPSDWMDTISSAPYFIKVSCDTVLGRDLVLLKYDQLNSDFSIPMVCECRGLILDAHTAEIVCFPFVKFFNYGEPHAADIDWNSAFVSSKLDGSIIKVVRIGNDFLISTNGTIDAFKCEVSNDVNRPFESFGDLALEGFRHYGLTKEDFPRLFKEGYTYMFELTSPWNQVVVKWDETKVSLIGVRDNLTGQEIPFFKHDLAKVFDTPVIYPITTIDECVSAAKELPDNEEGYVVCDADFNRIKVKSPRYVQLHYMAGNQTWSPARVLDIIRGNEISEYVSYFPRFKAAFDVINAKYIGFLNDLSEFKSEVDAFVSAHGGNPTRKEFASWLFSDGNRKKFQGFAFSYLDGKVKSVAEHVSNMRTSHILEFMGY